MKFLNKIILMLALATCTSVFAEDEEPLMPDVAFPASIEKIDNSNIFVNWKIADKYYLYRNKFKFLSDTPDVVLDEHVGRTDDVDAFRSGVTDPGIADHEPITAKISGHP